MSLAHVVRAALTDIDALVRLYRQLRAVPVDVSNLFEHTLAAATLRLRELEAVAHGRGVSVRTVRDVRVISAARGRLLDLELFIDPEQRLPRSGPGSLGEAGEAWSGGIGPQVRAVCEEWRERIAGVDAACQRLITELKSYVSLLWIDCG
jgi:hypothetical protein